MISDKRKNIKEITQLKERLLKQKYRNGRLWINNKQQAILCMVVLEVTTVLDLGGSGEDIAYP